MRIENYFVNWVPKSTNPKSLMISKKINNAPDDEMQEFWAEKIHNLRESENFFRIKEIPGLKSQVLAACKALLTGSITNSLPQNQLLSRLLYQAQNDDGRISDGYLIVLLGKEQNSSKFVCLLKVESNQGIAALDTLSLAQIKNIVMTQRSKVFKALYFRNGKMFAFDHQVKKNKLSTFWLHKYLECDYFEEAIKLTGEFIEFSLKLSKSRKNPERIADNIAMALPAYLASRAEMISYADFSNKLSPEARQFYKDHSKLDSVYSKKFPKKIGPSWKAKLLTRKYTLEDGITIIAPEEAFSKEIIKIQRRGNGKDYVKIDHPILRRVH